MPGYGQGQVAGAGGHVQYGARGTQVDPRASFSRQRLIRPRRYDVRL